MVDGNEAAEAEAGDAGDAAEVDDVAEVHRRKEMVLVEGDSLRPAHGTRSTWSMESLRKDGYRERRDE